MSQIIRSLNEKKSAKLQLEAHSLFHQAAELRKQAAALEDQGYNLLECAKSDAEREIEAIEIAGREWCTKLKDGGRRIEANGRIGIMRGGFGCCPERLYERLRDPSYAPRDGDRIACSMKCKTLGTEFVFADGEWWEKLWFDNRQRDKK